MVQCPNCHSMRVQKRGARREKDRYQCNKCRKYFTVRHISSTQVKGAKILLFDIETAPMEVYVWDLKYNNYINPDNVIKDYSVLCWSAKWLFDSKVMGAKVTGKQAIAREDETILEEMWKLLDQADIVIVQNGKKFDIPKLNTRFLKAGMPPPMYYKVVDTKEIMTKNFGFSSNKLDYVNQFLGIPGKTDMVWDDWKQCVEGSDEHIAKMLSYNKDDVVIMEDLYLKLRPWIPGHANLGIYADMDKDCCPNCQSTELWWGGQYTTATGIYVAFRCQACGAIGRGTGADNKIRSVSVRG